MENWEEAVFPRRLRTEEQRKNDIEKLFEEYETEKSLHLKIAILNSIADELRGAMRDLPKPISAETTEFLRDVFQKYDQMYAQVSSTGEREKLEKYDAITLEQSRIMLLQSLKVVLPKELKE